jgi:uncharacterized protein
MFLIVIVVVHGVIIGICDNRGVKAPWSVVIPALEASEALSRLVVFLKETGGQDVEVLVCSPQRARVPGARLVRAPAGRGPQLAAGAAAALGEKLFFLHADSLPPRDWRGQLERALAGKPRAAFAFSLGYEGGGLGARFVALGANLRSKLRSEPYGDQGLAMTAETYARSGGYRPLPLFEDVEFTRRLRQNGGVLTLPGVIVSSPERLVKRGAFANVLDNWRIKSAWEKGEDPETLWQRYTGRPKRTEALAVFAKPPVEGRVKTRLAAELGVREAAAVYRELAARAFEAARAFAASGGSAYLFYDGEPDQFSVSSGLWTRRQRGEGLGERLAHAHGLLFADGFSRVVTIGTDCPDADAPRLREAFDALKEKAAVFGPSEDGGYWLVGQSVPEPGVFEGIDWSTERVLAQSLARAQELELSVGRLETLRDIDTPEDLRAWRASAG